MVANRWKFAHAKRGLLSMAYSYDHGFKILTCGDSSVGKTSALNRSLYNKFVVDHIPTEGQFKTRFKICHAL